MKQCPRCKGAGKIYTADEDGAIGAKMKKEREQQGVALRAVARFLGKSPAYVSLLEHGKQKWNPGLEKKYKEAIS